MFLATGRAVCSAWPPAASRHQPGLQHPAAPEMALGQRLLASPRSPPPSLDQRCTNAHACSACSDCSNCSDPSAAHQRHKPCANPLAAWLEPQLGHQGHQAHQAPTRPTRANPPSARVPAENRGVGGENAPQKAKTYRRQRHGAVVSGLPVTFLVCLPWSSPCSCAQVISIPFAVFFTSKPKPESCRACLSATRKTSLEVPGPDSNPKSDAASHVLATLSISPRLSVSYLARAAALRRWFAGCSRV